MKTLKVIFAVSGIIFWGVTLSLAGLTLKEEGQTITINTGQIEVTLDKKEGLIKSIKKEMAAEIYAYTNKDGIFNLLLYPPLPDVLSPAPSSPIQQKDMSPGFKPGTQTENEIFFELHFTSSLADVQEVISLSKDKPYVKVAFDINYKTPAYEAVFGLSKPEGIDADKAILYPFLEKPIHRALYPPCYFAFVNEGQKEGLSIFAPSDTDIDRIGVNDFKATLGIKYIKDKPAYKGVFFIGIVAPGEQAVKIFEEVAPNSKKNPVAIIDFKIDKLIHQPDEEGKIYLTLQNMTSKEQQAGLELELASEIDKSEKVLTKDVTLKAYEIQKQELLFNTGKEDKYGLEAIVSIKQDKDIIARSADVFFVIKYWPQIFQKAVYYPGKGSAIYVAEEMRQNYVTLGHVFAWYPKRNVLAFDEEVIDSHQNGLVKSRQAMIDFNKECHKSGLKTSFYYGMEAAITGDLDLPAKDPTKLMYTRNGQVWPTYHGAYAVDIYQKSHRDFVADQFKKTIEMFGWDSVMIDCITVLGRDLNSWDKYYQYYNYKGAVIGKELADDPDTAGAKWINELKEKVRKVYPDFVFKGNGTGPGAGFLDTTGIGPKLYESAEIVLCELSGGGVAISEKSGVGQWNNLVETLNSIAQARHRMKLDKFPSYIMMPCQFGGEISMKGCAALVFANGTHLYTWWSNPKYTLFGEPMSQYYRFMTRYSAYIYHKDMKWIDRDTIDFIEVPEKKNLLWKDYVYEKETKEGKELIIHFVNLPENKFVWRMTDYPELYKNIPVTVTIKDNKFNPKEAYLLSPDLSGQKPIKLGLKKEGNRIVATIPEIRFYDILVIK